jgi:signal transduction histidine kinase
MISNLLKTIERGFGVMSSNSRMILVGVLVFVFPLIFIWITQSFFTTSYNNMQSVNKARVRTIHSATSIIIRQAVETNDLSSEIVQDIVSENEEIQAFRIFIEDDLGFRVLLSENPEQIGVVNELPILITKFGFTDDRDFMRAEFLVNGDRIWQAASRIVIADSIYYVFTEYNFRLIDSEMTHRRQQSYFGLTAIFVFLIALAYWLNKQTDWYIKHKKKEDELKERDLFTNMIAHEFRTPLTAIKGYASFLEESDSLQKEEVRFAQNIKYSADRLVLLVNDFLEVARLQSGKLEVEKLPVIVSDVFEVVVSELTQMASEKGLKLNISDASKNISFDTDEKRLIQILTNIVSNAIKYTDTGSVTIDCKDSNSYFIVYIKDTGTGISAEDQRKLFLPFSRVGGVDASSITGSGLGMWITKQLVSVLNGKIGVESIKGVGTHVVITFTKD